MGRELDNGESRAGPAAVLLVEDEPLLAMTTQAALEDGGHEVVVASNAVKALELLEGGFRPSALITDIRLGTGKNGWQLAVEARSHDPQLPVIYVSGDSGGEGGEHAVGGSLRLRKPILVHQLLSAIAQVSGSRTRSSEVS